ncbi:MAG: hypothetical protein OEY06_08740 [Gammaproteobacteria bacterium]|nr:hypothetical protein [Gammaproteobacteria bacterium]
MCFSVGVSLTSAVILVPLGLYGLKKTLRVNKAYWAFALLPIGFGMQQAFEAGVWWALDTNNTEILRLSALGFLFFSHLFWLVWIPLSSYFVETIKRRRILFLLIAIMGAISGTTMFLSFILHSSWLTVSVVNHSIHYQTAQIYDDYFPEIVLRTVYLLMVLLPLLLSSKRHLRLLGILMLLSMIATLTLFSFTFISVWCYFAALISLYIYYSILIKRDDIARQSL